MNSISLRNVFVFVKYNIFWVTVFLQALSINRSLSVAKSSAENGQVKCKELKDSVIKAICEAGGKIDYAEVTYNDVYFFHGQ